MYPVAVTTSRFTIPVDELGIDRAALVESFVQHVQHTQGKHPSAATSFDHFVSLVHAARDRMYDRWTRTWAERRKHPTKQVYYLSLEFLMGRLLADGLMALGIYEEA